MIADMAGKVCLVTGASSGIGKAAARGLAASGATIVLLCRNEKRGKAAQEDIIREYSDASVELLLADLASLDEVRTAANEFGDRFDRLDVLINNAGVFAGRRREVTGDGYELTFAVNHLAAFLLTNLMLDRMKACAPSRVVTVASVLHARGAIRFDDLQAVQSYSALGAYAQSKLANILFTRELARRLEGTGVTANCMHPGVVSTDLLSGNISFAGLGFLLARPFLRKPEKGADTIVYLATSPEVAEISGCYFVDRAAVSSSPASQDSGDAQRLWEVSEELTLRGDT